MRSHPRSWSSARRAATSSTTTRAAGGWAAGPRTRRSRSRGSGCASGRSLVADDEAAASTRARRSSARPASTCGSCPGRAGPIFINAETPTGRVQQTPQVSDPVDPAALPDGVAVGARVDARAGGGRDRRCVGGGPAPRTRSSRWAGRGCSGSCGPASPSSAVAPGPSPVVRRADLVGVGRDDVDRTTPPEDLAAHLHPGATMLFTDGERGGIGVHGRATAADQLVARPWASIPIRRYVDPVGAGDTFLAGVFAAWIGPSITGGLGRPRPGPAASGPPVRR